MPRKFQNFRQNFGAGEVSPRLSARVDIPKFPNFVKDGENFIVTAQSGAKFREGLEFIATAPSNQPYRLFQYHRGGDIGDVLIEVSVGVIRYWYEDETTGELILYENLETELTDEDDGFVLVDEDDGAVLVEGVVTDANPYTVDELESLYFTNQDQVAVICHENHPPLYITLRRDGEILAELLPKERIPLYVYSDINSPELAADSGAWTISFSEAWSGRSFTFYVTYNGVVATSMNGVLSFTFSDTDATNATNIETGLTQAALQQGLGTVFAVVAIDNLNYTVTVTGEQAGHPVGVFRLIGFSSEPLETTLTVSVQPADTSNTSAVAEPAWSYPTMVLHNGVYYTCLLSHTSTLADEPGVGADWESYWEELGIAVPPGFAYQYPDGNDWAVDTAYAPWGRGFPTVCVFYEQRLILMANKDNPTALYGSRIGGFSDFVPNVNDDDPFIYVLDSSDTPEIKWARPLRHLILGTSSGEWRIGSQITLTPSDINAEQQNSARSFLGIPAQVNNEIFYIEQGRRKLRATQYLRNVDGFTSTDVSIFAEQLICGDPLRRVIVGHMPDVLLTMHCDQGKLVFLTYQPSQEILAWMPGRTDGFVDDICGFFSVISNADWTYAVVQRNNDYVMERMRYPVESNPNLGLTEQGIVHLDSFVTGTVTGNTITGLDHLENKEVGVLIDDAWQVGTYRVKAGTVVLDKDYTGRLYAVGLLYQGVLETYEMSDNFRGTGLGAKRRWVELITRLYNSALPIVYTDRDRDRLPSVPMGISDNVRYGLQDVVTEVSGYGDGSIRLVMDRPYPVHVLAFFGEYQVEDR